MGKGSETRALCFQGYAGVGNEGMEITEMRPRRAKQIVFFKQIVLLRIIKEFVFCSESGREPLKDIKE